MIRRDLTAPAGPERGAGMRDAKASLARLRLRALLALAAFAGMAACDDTPTGGGNGASEIDNVVVNAFVSGPGQIVSLEPAVVFDCGGGAPSASTDRDCPTSFYDAGGGGEFGFEAQPDPGSTFDGWGQDCSSFGTAARCTLTFTEAEVDAAVAGGGELIFNVAASFSSAPGISRLEGTILDTDSLTPVPDLVVNISRGGTGVARDTTDAQGRFEAEDLSAGEYAVSSVGLNGFRWLSTPGDTVDVPAADTTVVELTVRSGYGLDITSGSLGTVTASAGQDVTLDVDFRIWNRDLCPGCEPSIAIGVDGDALDVHRLGGPAGVYPGTTGTATFSFQAPGQGGTLYASIILASTAGGIQPGLDLYEQLWSGGNYTLYFIDVGTFQVN